jgi:hypothetical protein
VLLIRWRCASDLEDRCQNLERTVQTRIHAQIKETVELLQQKWNKVSVEYVQQARVLFDQFAQIDITMKEMGEQCFDKIDQR